MIASKRFVGLFIALSALSALSAPALSAETAEVGKPAPDFQLTDSSGKTHRLSDYRGKVVVLEWVNYECPFVKKHYGSGNMQKLQSTYTADGVVWLTINTGAKGDQGVYDPAEVNRLVEEKGAAGTAYLFDPKGEVGRLYGARTTPHMYVITEDGTLVYNGAIDSIRSNKAADIPKAENYVVSALAEVTAGKPVSTPVTTPYGCGVKY